MRILLVILLFLSIGSIPLNAQYKENGRNKIVERDGSITKGRTKNFLKEGTWKSHYANGKLKSTGKYHEGNPRGEHLAWFPNGKLASVTNYTSSGGLYDGPSIWYSESGDTTRYMVFSHGIQSGAWVIKTAIGERTQGKYSNGKRDSLWIITSRPEKEYGYYVEGMKEGWWVKDSLGFVDSSQYHSGLLNGKTISRTPDPQELSIVFYKNGKRDSIAQYFSQGHLYIETWYRQDYMYKYQTVYFRGTDQKARHTIYSAPNEVARRENYNYLGFLTVVTWYHPGSTPSTEHLYRDSMHVYKGENILFDRFIHRSGPYGQCITWYEEHHYYAGHVSSRAWHELLGKDSLRYTYYLDGSLMRSVNYKDGAATGPYRFYYDNGNLKMSCWMMAGVYADSLKVFSENGKQLKKGTPAHDKIFREVDSAETDLRFLDQHLQISNEPLPPQSIIREQAGEVDPAPLPGFPDVMPMFPGGEDSMRAFIKRSIKYPREDVEMGNQGVVYVECTIDQYGKVTNPVVRKNNTGSKSLEQEAIRVVKAMPAWKPGTANGKPIAVKLTIPVRFILD